MPGCKINLSIFGSGTVQTQSGTINCTSDGTTQSGDCTQTYNVDANNVACNPATDPNCTVVTASQDVHETLVPTAPQDNTFKGFDGGCIGAGPCTLDISKDDADHAQDVAIEAHFEEDAAPSTATYTYNYLNQRQSKTVNGTTTYYVYDEQGHLLSELDASGNSIKDYVYMDGEYVAHVEQTGDTANGETQEQVYYPLNDHLGQPIMMLRADEKLTHEQYTDPYGKAYASYTDTSIGTGPTGQNIRLPGQYNDDETGYSYNWNRYFDPTTGGYLQNDLLDALGRTDDPQLLMAQSMGVLRLPAGLVSNPTYLYANAMPTMGSDPYGLLSGCEWWFGGCHGTVDSPPTDLPSNQPPTKEPKDTDADWCAKNTSSLNDCMSCAAKKSAEHDQGTAPQEQCLKHYGITQLLQSPSTNDGGGTTNYSGGDGDDNGDNSSGSCPQSYSSPPPSGCTFVPNIGGGYTVVCPQYH